MKLVTSISNLLLKYTVTTIEARGKKDLRVVPMIRTTTHSL